MLRNVVLFFAALLLALTAGRAFWVWLGESPFNMSGRTYVEFFQQLDKRIVVPIGVTGIGGTILAGLRRCCTEPIGEPSTCCCSHVRSRWLAIL